MAENQATLPGWLREQAEEQGYRSDEFCRYMRDAADDLERGYAVADAPQCSMVEAIRRTGNPHPEGMADGRS